MTYDFSTRLDRLGTRMKQLNSNSLSYQRTGESSVTVENFTPEKIDVNELAIHGIPLIQDKMQSIVFDTTSLADWSDPLPKEKDKFVWDGRTFEVFIIGEKAFNFTTSTRKRIRVNGRQIS